MGSSRSLEDLPTTASDYVPLLLKIKPHNNSARYRFKFELFWLKHREVEQIAAETWSAVLFQRNPVQTFK